MMFRTAAGGTPQIASLEVSTADSITFRNRRVLPILSVPAVGGRRDFDITPDGERMVMVYPLAAVTSGATALDRIDIVLNWHREVMTRVPIP